MLKAVAHNWPDEKPKQGRSDAANWALTAAFLVCLIALCCLIREVRSEHAVTVGTNNEAREINAKWSRALGILESEGIAHAP